MGSINNRSSNPAIDKNFSNKLPDLVICSLEKIRINEKEAGNQGEYKYKVGHNHRDCSNFDPMTSQ